MKRSWFVRTEGTIRIKNIRLLCFVYGFLEIFDE